MNRIHILIVEDDVDISTMLVELLSAKGYETSAAFSGTQALRLLKEPVFHLVLLDLMLPELSGERVLQTLRETSNIPVIALSAKDSPQIKIDLLRSGADDYITKPFLNEELLARMEALLRRSGTLPKAKKQLRHRGILLDEDTMEVTVHGTPIELTRREFLILRLLMSAPSRVFSKNNIYESVWNEPYLGEDNAVSVHISNLRQKLSRGGTEDSCIKTVWGIGFKLE